MTHCRQPARHARRFEAAGIEVGKVVPQRFRLGTDKILAVRCEEFGEVDDVKPIGI
jgi:hypothetical protein